MSYGKPRSVLADNADTNTTGVKLSYTVPPGAKAVLESARAQLSAGTAPQMRLELVRGAATFFINVAAVIPQALDTLGIALEPGDIVRWNCTTLGASSTADLFINVCEDN
jgi:hypothetical protein